MTKITYEPYHQTTTSILNDSEKPQIAFKKKIIYPMPRFFKFLLFTISDNYSIWLKLEKDYGYAGYWKMPISCSYQSQVEDLYLTQFRSWVFITCQQIYINIKRGFIQGHCFGLKGPLLPSVSIFNESFFCKVFKGRCTASKQCPSYGLKLRRIPLPI